MPIERLRVGCGLQCTLPHLPLGPSSRPLLFSAAVKLLKFALSSGTSETNDPAETALWHALFPLLCNRDEHVLATLGSLVVGLLFEPSLKLMILTKENVAAQAFAEHIESFGLPEFVTSKISWSQLLPDGLKAVVQRLM